MKITYITYQGIPSYNTFAYGICTFSSIKYFVKNNFKVKLVFPLREKNATTEISKLQEFYEMYEDFEPFFDYESDDHNYSILVR